MLAERAKCRLKQWRPSGGPHQRAALSIETEARTEILECIPVIHPQGNDRAEYRREGVTRHAQPVSPRPILPGLLNQRFTDIKEHRINYHETAS